MSLLTFLGPIAAQASSCKSLFSAENLELTAIEKRLRTNEFEVGRGFEKSKPFLRAFDIPTVEEILSQLEPGAVWLDLGAGLAKFQRDFLLHPIFKSLQLQLIALGFRKPKDDGSLDNDLKMHKNNFQYISGRFVELLKDPRSKLSKLKGKVSFITEVFGPLAYDRDLNEGFNAIADLLKINGKALLYFEESWTHIMIQDSTGAPHRITLRELSHLIPVLTGGRLRVIEARANRPQGGDAQFTSTVLFLEKISEGTFAPIPIFRERKTPIDHQPTIRFFDLVLPNDIELDAEGLRQQDLEKEEGGDGMFYPYNIPGRFVNDLK